MKERNPQVMNRVRVPSRSKRHQFLFGVHVPGTRGTVICDGKRQRVVDVDPKDLQFH